MQISSLRLTNFRLHKELFLDLRDEDRLPRELVVLVGPNGCGKSTVLQAIIAVLGEATGRIRSATLELPGLVWSSAAAAHSGPWRIQLETGFSRREIGAIQQAALAAQRVAPLANFEPPEQAFEQTLWLEQGRMEVLARSRAAKFQHQGRRYAQLAIRELGPTAFDALGTLFWYTEERRATSGQLRLLAQDPAPTLDDLREGLMAMENDHLRQPQLHPDTLYARLKRAWKLVFPERDFVGSSAEGTSWEATGEQARFLFTDEGGHPYELAELSAGERAVFPILWDLVRWRVHHSVVLIDELELHLHPPLQQALVRALPQIGQGNQFILTTHSDHVLAVVPEDAVIRIGGN